MTVPVEQWRDVDVVVVGSGAGGLVAALAAAHEGLRAVVLEKAPWFGGTTALSGAGLWAPANLHVLAAGQPDSIELARTYLEQTVGDRTATALQEAFLQAAPRTIAWLEEQGVRFSYMTGYPDYHPTLPGGLLTGRAITPKALPGAVFHAGPDPVHPPMPMGAGGPPIPEVGPEGPVWGGQSLIFQLLTACRAAGVGLLASTAFTDLVVEQDRVVGVRAVQQGREAVINARAGVVLAAGGFERDADLRRQAGQGIAARDDWTLGVEENTGDGLRAARALGAATDLLEDCWWAPGFLRPDGHPSFLLWERVAPGGIIVDQAGRRWLNEGVDYNTFGHLMLAAHRDGRPVVPSWFVMDRGFLAAAGFGGLRPGADPAPWVASGALRCADTVAELATTLGAPELEATVRRWNDDALRGVDQDFGRAAEGSHERQLLAVFQRYPGIGGPHEHPNPGLAPLAEGPFYAAQVVLSDLGTKGGLVCDTAGRVLREDGTPIAGLHACGNTAASVMGHSYPGPGACITPAMVFGQLAAQALAGELSGARS